tara:strand:+ start:6185 stop:7246 length:1062 start_codon:yes stop_codon:yes gene_type:complete
MENNKENINSADKLCDDHEFFMIDDSNVINKVSSSKLKTNILSSLSSVSGEKGEKGDVGEYGDSGLIGTKGSKGLPGERGTSGEKGRKGQIGDFGDFGAVGIKGDTGQKGNSGIKGETGNRGFQGKTGDKGDKGSKGNRGSFGVRGLSGQTPALEPEQGSKGEPGDDEFYAKRGERGKVGDRGDKGEKGKTGRQGSRGSQIGELTHAVYGAKVVRNWTDLNITSGNYVHLSYFKKDETSIAYKYFKLILELPDNSNLMTPTSDLNINLMIPGEITNYKPIIVGQSPIIWIKNEFDTDVSRVDRKTNRIPRVVYLDYHSDKSNLGVYIPTKNSGYVSENKINLKIKKMLGTNDI